MWECFMGEGRMLFGARMEHGARRMEEIKGNYYLMSECFRFYLPGTFSYVQGMLLN
jgi:hypothetical protein